MKEEIRKQMKEFLEENGFKFGAYDILYKVHSIGLPKRTYVMVKPEYSTVDGTSTIVVTAYYIAKYNLKIPYEHNEWKIEEAINYDSKAKLIELLDEWTKEPKGVWG
jgi:hypothetical protein